MYMKLAVFLLALLGATASFSQTPAYTCNSGQFVNSQLANTGQQCGAPLPVGGGAAYLHFSIIQSLFATTQTLGPVYFIPNAATLKAVVTRLSGSPVCTAAPTVVILDLGTSASTAYASATILTSQATGTSNGVFSSTALSVAVSAGHFLGFGLSAGTCVTAPTISTTVNLQ